MPTFNSALWNESEFNDSGVIVPPAAGWRSPFFFGIGGGFIPLVPPVLPAWTLGTLWSVTTLCVKNGLFGLQRTGNGITGSSDVTSNRPIIVSGGTCLFTSFWLKASVGTDGQIGFGYSFYDVNGVFISSLFIQSSGTPPTNWVQLSGNITIPTNAVTAIPVVRSFAQLAGTWCIDSVLGVIAGGNFTLSSLRHWWSERESYR